MQMLIDISVEDYARIKTYKEGHTQYLYPLSERLYESVKYGTPLPGHGKIIDADKVINSVMSAKDWYAGGDQHYWEGAKVVLDMLEQAKPIIKAEEADYGNDD